MNEIVRWNVIIKKPTMTFDENREAKRAKRNKERSAEFYSVTETRIPKCDIHLRQEARTDVKRNESQARQLWRWQTKWARARVIV